MSEISSVTCMKVFIAWVGYLNNLITCTTALSNLVKLWAMLCRATQDGQVMVEGSDRTSTGEENGKPLYYSCLETPMNSMKKQKDRTLKDELFRFHGVAESDTTEQLNWTEVIL